MQAELKVVEGKQQGAVIPLNRKKFLIGREEDCQLRPNSDLVSRHHCVFTMDDYTVRIRDLGSTNGTFVNGKRATGQVVLKHGDEIRIGKLVFQIAIWEPVPEAVPEPLVAPAVPAPVPLAYAAQNPVAPPVPEYQASAPQYQPLEPAGDETVTDFAIGEPQVDETSVKTGFYAGDTTLIAPKPIVAESKQPLPVKLPPPESTGVQPVVAAPPVEGGSAAPAPAASSAANTRSSAADIIRQYMQQRPTAK